MELPDSVTKAKKRSDTLIVYLNMCNSSKESQVKRYEERKSEARISLQRDFPLCQ